MSVLLCGGLDLHAVIVEQLEPAGAHRGVANPQHVDIRCMEIDQALDDPLQPCVNVLTGQEGVARIEVDPDGRRRNEVVNAVKPLGVFSIGSGTPARS